MFKKTITIIALALLGINAQAQSDYGNNIIRIAPFSAYDVGVGLNLSYERHLDKKQQLSVVVPINFLFNLNYNANGEQDMYYAFTPGLKFYPSGQKKVTYAVGPSMFFLTGQTKEWESSGWSQQLVTKERFIMGLLVNNYLNFNISKNFLFGMEAGLGLKYVDKTTNKTNPSSTFNNGINALGQFSLTFGVRL